MTFWTRLSKVLFPKRSAKMIDDREKRKCHLAFELQSSLVFEKRSNLIVEKWKKENWKKLNGNKVATFTTCVTKEAVAHNPERARLVTAFSHIMFLRTVLGRILDIL